MKTKNKNLLIEIFEKNPAQGFANFIKMKSPVGIINYLDFVLEERTLENGIKSLGLKTFSKSIMADTRQISTKINIETIEREKEKYGIDIEERVDSALVKEAKGKIAEAVVKKIGVLGEKNYQLTLKWYHKLKVFKFFFPRWKKRTKIEKPEDLLNLFISTSNKIGHRGRFGPANFAIVDTEAARLIQIQKEFTFIKGKTNLEYESIYKLGNFKDIEIFVDLHKLENNQMILGHRNTNNLGVLVGFYEAKISNSPKEIERSLYGDHEYINKRLVTRCGIVETGSNPSANYEKVYLRG